MLGYRPTMTIRTLLTVAVLTLATVSCSSSTTSASGDAVTQPIGPEGGVIQVAGATVTFPKGAVAASTNVTISVEDSSAAPAGFVVLSKVCRCEPSGTTFTQPVEMRMPFVDDGGGATLLWSSGADPTFTDLGGTKEGNLEVATVMHFSSGFVGRKQ